MSLSLQVCAGVGNRTTIVSLEPMQPRLLCAIFSALSCRKLPTPSLLHAAYVAQFSGGDIADQCRIMERSGLDRYSRLMR